MYSSISNDVKKNAAYTYDDVHIFKGNRAVKFTALVDCTM